MITEEQKFNLLKEKYFYLQKQCDEFDNRALIIKNWSITASLAGIVTGFINKAPVVFLIAALCSILFWIIETLWKSFQTAAYPRLYLIEEFFKERIEGRFRVPDASGSWNHSYSKIKLKDRLKIAFRPHVFLPHLIIFIMGFALFLSSLL